MSKRNRAWRRAQDERVVKKAFDRIFRNTSPYQPLQSHLNWAMESARKRADNFCSCSSFCCGNPRRWFGEKTLNERRFEDDE